MQLVELDHSKHESIQGTQLPEERKYPLSQTSCAEVLVIIDSRNIIKNNIEVNVFKCHLQVSLNIIFLIFLQNFNKLIVD